MCVAGARRIVGLRIVSVGEAAGVSCSVEDGCDASRQPEVIILIFLSLLVSGIHPGNRYAKAAPVVMRK